MSDSNRAGSEHLTTPASGLPSGIGELIRGLTIPLMLPSADPAPHHAPMESARFPRAFSRGILTEDWVFAPRESFVAYAGRS